MNYMIKCLNISETGHGFRGRSDMMSSLRGEGDISQKMTIDDKEGRGGPSKYDGDGMEKKMIIKKN